MWAIMLVVFNVVVFAIRPIVPGYVIRYDARFWISWVSIMAAFGGQLFCAKKAFDSKNNEKLFLNLSLITLSHRGLVALTVFGCILMLIPNLPAWVALIVCAIVIGFHAIAIVKAELAADSVSKIDDKIRVQTFFIKSLTVDAERVLASAQTEEAKAECKKVYETIRYSDPMSSDALATAESQITLKFAELEAAVNENNLEAVKDLAKAVIILVEDRNKKCKLLK